MFFMFVWKDMLGEVNMFCGEWNVCGCCYWGGFCGIVIVLD